MKQDKELQKLIPKNVEQEKLVEQFLDDHLISKKLRGRYFLKQMILYILNDEDSLYLRSNSMLYNVIAKANHCTWYNVMRLIRYALKKTPLFKNDVKDITSEFFWEIKKDLEKKGYYKYEH